MPAASRQPALWVLAHQTEGVPVAAASMALVAAQFQGSRSESLIWAAALAERNAFAAIDPAKK